MPTDYIKIKTCLVIALLVDFSISQAPECCSQTAESCRTACEEISLVEFATDEEWRTAKLENLAATCKGESSKGSFWACINKTIEEINLGENWYGRFCCPLPKNKKCRELCIKTTSKDYLLPSCKHTEEVDFYTCLRRQENAEKCCGPAGNASLCHQSCKDIFSSSVTPSDELTTRLLNQCNQSVINCVMKDGHLTITNLAKKPHCCDRSLNVQCRKYCRQLLHTAIEGKELVDILDKYGCGLTISHGRLWTCFFRDSKHPSSDHVSQDYKLLGLDNPKYQCCSRGVSLECQRLCQDMTSIDINAINNFELKCVGKFEESDMVQCLADVDEPCELGCERLSYCVNFNNRPTELFRTCNIRADNAASNFYSIWQRGIINAGGNEFALLDISQCQPDIWKALACVQQMQPCPKLGQFATKICRSECEKYLMSCVDKSRLPKGMFSSAICDYLAAGSDEQCVSLKPYLVEGKYTRSPIEVSFPCTPNPCNATQVCIVNRNCYLGRDCLPYKCVSGCRMGEMSRLVVRVGTYVRVANIRKCYTICYCNLHGKLDNCKDAHCEKSDNCYYQGKKITHNTQFVQGCNICFCYAGGITCTKKHCPAPGRSPEKVLPCNCPDHYVPVCGANGKTYPSACLARCNSLSDDQFEFGACSVSDPCSPNSCSPDERCVPRKRVCLSIVHKACKQYDCVNIQLNCNQQESSPVCDKDNIEHKNLCWMLQKGKVLAHYGKCMHHCRSYGPVCGHNGETYESECASWAERVLVDYQGACVAVGIFDGSTTTRCNSIKCPPLTSKHCPRVYPPGACCPVCGAALGVLFSRQITNQVVQIINDIEPVIVQTIAEKLREDVKALECDVFAYLGVESYIITVIVPTTDHPTKIQIESCIREAEKLESSIQKGDPTLVTELSLTFITGAFMIEPVDDAGPVRANILLCVLALLLSLTFCNS